MAFSEDDRWIASGDLRGGIRLWRTDKIDSAPKILRGHSQEVYSLAFDTDGRYLFSGSFDNTVWKWDLATKEKRGSKIIDLDRLDRKIRAIAQNGDRLFVATFDISGGVISMWRLGTDQAALVAEIKVKQPVPCFVVHPDGTRIYTGNSTDSEHELTEWRTTSDSTELVGVVARLDDATTSAMALNERGTLLAVGDSLGRVHLYKPSEGALTEVARFVQSSAIESLAFSADGKRLYAGADRVVQGWDLDRPNDAPAVVMRGRHFESIDVTRDGSLLVSGGHDEEDPCLWYLKADDLLDIARRKTGRELTDEDLHRFNIAAPVE